MYINTQIEKLSDNQITIKLHKIVNAIFPMEFYFETCCTLKNLPAVRGAL